MNKIFIGIKNLIRWFPVIWKDRDWDYDFIYCLLYHKIRLMEYYFENHSFITDEEAHRIADELAIVKSILSRLIKDNYLMETSRAYDEKYQDQELFKFVPCKDRPEFSRLMFIGDEEQRKMFDKCCQQADQLKEEDKRYLFSYMKEHIENWWD